MIVHDLVEAKEYFENETKNDYLVLYEKFQNSKCDFEENGRFCMKEADQKEVVQILRGREDDTLYSVKNYDVNEFSSVEAILEKVKTEYQEIFV
ncbi:hypothetical protein [Alteribacillus sp. YIM 98480]|uniref:hypothetical protein n=1 Tax=Alteribacillus sp. YIM 98480 TaxID=2606599 RepID=UPI00131BDA91|nr:hypothetical protein [Alteribacillus sp. YIM 98480]